MDAESLKSLTWLIVWGGFFYFMMRYGCGAHMMGGHKHGGHGDAAPGGYVKDPVCGMAVDPKNAAATAEHGGTTYYFCSASCHDKFEQTPAHYTGSSTQAGQQHGGHRYGL